MGIFAQAKANLPLTPGERMALKLFDGLVIVFLAAALPIVWQYFVAWQAGTGATIDWGLVADNALKTGAVAVVYAILKYLRAVQDAAAGRGVMSDAGKAIEQNLGLSDAMMGTLAGAVADAVQAKMKAVAPNVDPNGVTQLSTFQTFALPDDHVPVQAPNGIYVAAPAAALPGGPGTNGLHGTNDAGTLAQSDEAPASSGSPASN